VREGELRKKAFSATVLVILLIGLQNIAANGKTAKGWSNGGYSPDPQNPVYGTHDWIAQHALDWLPTREKQYILDNLVAYLYGTELPDNGGAPDGIGDTAKHHVYFRSSGNLQDDASALRAETEFTTAESYIMSSNYALAAKTLGIMSHYIVDVSVFGHVMGSGTDWGAETHHSDYEDYANDRTDNYTDTFNTYLAFDGSLEAISAYNASYKVAYDTTFDVDGDLTCVWMDQNYDWNNPTFKDRCGESLNLAVNVLADVLHTFYLRTMYAWTDWTHYHNYTEIVTALQYLNSSFPTLVDVFSIGKSWNNLDIYCIRLTNENLTQRKPQVFFVGYHHAREPITIEVPLYFAINAANNYSANATIRNMLDLCEIYIVVALNVDGIQARQANEWQRKNVHPFDEDNDTLLDEDPPDDEDGDGYIEDLYYWDGIDYYFIRWEGLDDDHDGLYNEDWIGGVDLNRNYGYQWNASTITGSPNPENEDYRGPEPFSEPETQAIRDLTLQHEFKYAISFHSGAELILYPWGHTYELAPHDDIFQETASDLSSLTEAPYQQSSQLYTASGLWEDWMYYNRSTLAFTCEIYENYSAWQYDLGPEPNTWWERGITQAFNPDPENIMATIQRWLPVFTYITDRAITQASEIAITDITPYKTIVGQGFPIRVNVTVKNQDTSTKVFNVTLYANTTIIDTKQVTLSGQATTTLTFTWSTTGWEKGHYIISATADKPDNIRIDGTIKVGIPGDINTDDYTGIDDIFEIATHFGKQPGDPGRDAKYDINDDDYVGIDDIFTAASHFGEQYP
jgi:hypothetical protein